MPTPQNELYRLITLTKGQHALVDTSDFEWLNQWKWFAAKRNGKYYVQRNLYISPGNEKTLYIHRVILGLEAEDNILVDHINLNPLDNRRSNLRLATRSQNAANCSPRSASGYKGVYYIKRDRKWQSQIFLAGRLVSLGYFLTPEEASEAYKKAAYARSGEFARCL